MSALERIKELQCDIEALASRIEILTQKENDLISQAESVGDEKQKLIAKLNSRKEAIELATDYAREAEQRAEEIFRSQQAAFNTLYVKHSSSGATDSDYEEFCEAAGFDIPITEDSEGDPVEVEVEKRDAG